VKSESNVTWRKIAMLILKHTESPKQRYRLYFYVINITGILLALA
jgi:hypothetical protein